MNAEKFKAHFIKTKSILKKSILLAIDNQAIAPEQVSCDFYTHPDGKIPGMLCFYPLDSLHIGRHTLTIGKVIGKKSRKSNKIKIDTIYQTIPFIYTGQY